MQKKWCYIFITIILLMLITAACEDEKEESQVKQIDQQENNTENTETAETETPENIKEEAKETEAMNANGEDEISLKDIPPIPTDEAGLANQEPGPFAKAKNIYEMEQEISEKMEKLGPMSENPSNKEYEKYLRYMYWLVAEDYPNPNDTIKKWEFASFGNPDLPDARYHFKENYNIEIILDASGSMAADTGGKTRMQLAKESIKDFLSSIPEEANVSLRVYGHKGSGSDSDKELSCGAIEQVYGFSSYDEAKFQKALDKFEPKGWTPIAAALSQSKEALKQFDAKNNTNLIYLVSDGIGTCDGDPVKVAKSLSESNAKPIINIIGFQTDNKAQQQLEEMAEVSGGIFASANDQEELKNEFERAEEVLKAWERWKDDALDQVDAKRVDNNFDILAIHNDWSFTTLSISNHMASLADVLYHDLELVTLDQKEEIDRRRRKVIEEIDNTADELEKKLENISVKTIEKMKRSIEAKYNEKTED